MINRLNQWLTTVGDHHHKHLSIRCSTDSIKLVEVISHHAGLLEEITREEAYELCKLLVEELSINSCPFSMGKSYYDIEIVHGVISDDVGFMGMLIPQGDGFVLTLTGTLTKAEAKKVSEEVETQKQVKMDKWRSAGFNRTVN